MQNNHISFCRVPNENEAIELGIGHAVRQNNQRNTQEISLALAEQLLDNDIRRQERQRLRKISPKKGNNKPEATFRGLGCRGKSHKKHRRFENSNC